MRATVLGFTLMLLVGLMPSTPVSRVAAAPSAGAVVEAFIAAGLPIAETLALAEDTDRLLGRPGQYIEKVSWRDSRVRYQADTITIDSGGTVEAFATIADRDARNAYIATFDGTPLGREYRYAEGLMLLRVPWDLTPSQAEEYRAIFAQIANGGS
jgi:hypothetical protein